MLINCPECNNQISDQAANCPNCAFPISSIPSSTVSVKSKSGVKEGVKMGCGAFIVLPIMIGGALLFLLILIGTCNQ